MQNQEIHPYMELLWDTVTIEFMIKFFIVYFFAVWVALVIWVARDISNRTESRFYQAICVLIMICLTPLGIFLYLLIRPGKSMYEKYTAEIEENLEILNQIVEDRLLHQEDGDIFCPSCDEAIDPDFIICPSCKQTLKHTCRECNKEIRESWKVCPYCQTKQKKKKKKTD